MQFASELKPNAQTVPYLHDWMQAITLSCQSWLHAWLPPWLPASKVPLCNTATSWCKPRLPKEEVTHFTRHKLDRTSSVLFGLQSCFPSASHPLPFVGLQSIRQNLAGSFSNSPLWMWELWADFAEDCSPPSLAWVTNYRNECKNDLVVEIGMLLALLTAALYTNPCFHCARRRMCSK